MSDNIISSPPSQLPLRDKLFHISRDLSEEETHKLKFLLKDLLPKTELTANVKARRLFQCLEERVKIQESDPKLLVQCLVLIGRERLAAKYFPNHDKRMQTDYLSDFRFKLFEVATELKHKEKDHLLEVFSGIPKSTVESITTSYDLLAYLEERVIIAEQDTTRLQTALGEIGRDDLANVLVIFHGGVPSEESQVISQACASVSSSASSSTTSVGNLTDSQFITQENASMHSTFGYETDNSAEVNIHNVDADDMDLLTTAANSVGWLGMIGTGFRVGSKYIMTASHVIKMALNNVGQFEPMTLKDIQTEIDKQGVSIHFKHRGDPLPVLLGKIVFFEDCKDAYFLGKDDSFLDVTIAELKPPTGYTLPDPLINFYDDFRVTQSCKGTPKNLHLIGHNGASEKLKIGRALTIISGTVKEEMVCEFNSILPNEVLKYKIIHRVGTDPKRVQFRGTFRWGGSGCPCVVIKDGQVKVFTILTHGFFHESPIVPAKLHIQEGPRLWHIKDMLKSQNADLCRDVFGDWDSSNVEESADMDITEHSDN